MAVLASLLLACSLHLDDPLLSAVVDAFSGGNAFAVADVAPNDGQDHFSSGFPPQSRAEATAELARIVGAGGAPVAGLLPLRLTWLDELGKPRDGAFDACVDIEVASAKISEFDYQCRALGARMTAPARRACTLARYGASLGLPGLRPLVMASLAAATPAASSEPAEVPEVLYRPGGIFYPDGPR